MSPQHRGNREPDFNDELAAAVAAWGVAWDAIYPLEHNYKWSPTEAAQLKQLKSAKRFMMSAKTCLRKLAVERANAPDDPAEWLRSFGS